MVAGGSKLVGCRRNVLMLVSLSSPPEGARLGAAYITTCVGVRQ